MNKDQKHLLFEALFENATESILVADGEGRIKFVNPATNRYFGYAPDELLDKKVEQLMPEKYMAKHQDHRMAFNRHPHSRAMGSGMDLYARRKDGSTFPVEISLSPFKYENQTLIIAFIIDITKRKEIEQAMVQQQQTLKDLTNKLTVANEKLESRIQDRTRVLSEALIELEKSRKELTEALEKEKELNELKSRFISMASHEFRTPLTAILSSASLIQEYPKTEQQEKRMKHVDRITSAVNNLNDILSDFLSISKIEEGKVLADFMRFNIKSLISEVCSDMRNIAKPGQQILFEHTGPELVRLDPKLIRNILINLISNSIKFSAENKKIKVVTLSGSGNLVLTVTDEGIGISEEDKKHLFERFFRGHNVTNIQGTGLGLNIVANYVELMHGNIEMKSELEEGTTVKIQLPISS